MPVRTVRARREVSAVRGRIAFERGPLLYCAESMDNPWDFFKARVEREVRATTITRQDITLLEAPTETQPLRLIPYALWDNRGTALMRVWFPVK